MPLLLLAAMLLKGPLPPCLPHQQGGVVVAVLGDSAPQRSPYLSRAGFSDLPGDNQLLCPGDVLANPVGSGMRIKFRLSGDVTRTMEPGDPSLTVPVTGFFTKMKALGQRAQSLFDYMASLPSGVRGGDADAGPYPLPDTIFAVPDWGPLVIAWSRQSEGTVRIGEGADSAVLTGMGFIKIDLRRYCPTSCTIAIRAPGTNTKHSVSVRSVTVEQAMKELEIRQIDRRSPRVMFAAWLAAKRRDPAWRLQRASLLWNTSCEYPAFLSVVQADYQLEQFPEPCEIQ